MLPNILGPLTVVATFGVATAVLLESSLSFLGLGVRPPEASWGNLITEAVSPVVLNQLPWQWVPAAAAITLTVLGVNFIGDGLRDAIDPKTVEAWLSSMRLASALAWAILAVVLVVCLRADIAAPGRRDASAVRCHVVRACAEHFDGRRLGWRRRDHRCRQRDHRRVRARRLAQRR